MANDTRFAALARRLGLAHPRMGAGVTDTRTRPGARWRCLALAIVLLSAALPLIGSEPAVANRGNRHVRPQVVNGSPVEQGQDRFVVALLRKSRGGDAFKQQYCGGAMVAKDWVLTAAHCVRGQVASHLAVFIGQVDLTQAGTTIDVAQFAIAPNFDPRHTANDVALVQLRQTIPADLYAPIAMVAGGDTTYDAPGTPVNVAGWGATKATPPYDDPRVLQQADILILPDGICGSSWSYGEAYRPASMLCAGNNQTPVKDACYGDSGGPLFAETPAGPIEVGIASFGRSCAFLRYPGVYTRLSSPALADWLHSVLACSEHAAKKRCRPPSRTTTG
jgi:secreted trypsin-like serine protease